ncbi:ATP-binding cassette domain-containing protein, partial [Streptomyces sp. NPDC056049]|uniref:ATP-binding cassette domain-containing protein n=1 Tax=Streptomyces sp. NPDC056049 TaxID=3345693 RepID=UPI0035E14FB4
RYPAQLSGGQRQRVGVARALAADPPVLLMDEPFGAVDPVVRERLQNEFLALQATVRKTVLLVTHDIEEAVRMGDRMAVYGQGRIEQFDTPATVLASPATPYVADFVGGDRALKRLAVTPVTAEDLDPLPAAPDGTPATPAGSDGTPATRARAEAGHAPRSVPLGGTLKDALALLLQDDSGHLTVTGADGRPLGTLTPAGVHRALRRAG